MQLGTETGSFMNHLMSGNKSLPEVGKGATILLYSDRHAYQVMKVEGKRVWIKRCVAKRVDNNGMSESQDYDYSELYEWEQELVFRNNHWREVTHQIEYIDENMYSIHHSERMSHFDEHGRLNLIEGITKKVFSYPKVNIIFGSQREYYDFTR